MFSTQERLQRRTPKGGINRKTYLCLLVDEYYETSNIVRTATSAKYSRFRQADVQRSSANNVPCTCAIFLTGQFNRFNRTEQPKGNPGIQMELMQHFPCTTSGNKQCSNKCLDSIVKHLPNSQNVICATIDRDCFRERAYLFYQNCAPRWVNSNISAGKEFCCQNDSPMRCSLMAELIRQSLRENNANNTTSTSSEEQNVSNR
uniref:Follicle cell protein 3C-1 n=1 Tax=Anopheles culicifacies TaxID=139723 RepID=A0A182MPC2_9DIPT